MTGDEWLAASTTPGFVAAPSLFEWTESIDEKQKTIRAPGKIDTRPDAKQKDVTFRTARNL